MFNMTPEMRDFLLHMGGGLLMGGRNNAEAVGRGLLMGAQGRNEGMVLRSRDADAKQNRAAQQMQMDEQARQRQEQQGIRDVYSRNTMPGNLAPQDDEGNAMPAAPQGFNMQGLQQGLMGAGPAGFREAAAIQGMMPKPQPLMNVPAGGSIFDPSTRQAIYNAPHKAPDWLDPRYVEVQSQIRAAGRPQVNVSTNMPPLEKKEQQDMGALHVKNYGDMQTAAGVARKENSLLTALAKNPIQTSAATPLTSTAAAWLSAAGLGGEDVKKLASDAQQFNAVAKDLVLQKQLAQKGPQTESDARRLEQTVASLGNTPESNAAIIAFSLAQNNRTIQQERFYNAYWQKKGTMRGADEEWINGPGAKSLWDDPSLKRFAPQEGGPPSVEDIDAEIRRRLKK
jgi:hypothetical protein